VRLDYVDRALEAVLHPELEPLAPDELVAVETLVREIEPHAQVASMKPDGRPRVQATRGGVGARQDVRRPRGEVEHALMVRTREPGAD